ncbi:uncharacterized protein LOC123387983 [Mustela putorius furo]|uniref:Uncharacterized protein LOC123387983 n=1 Tax=Mustela putorius furo TaxID=9669 RepID=A0A8U0RCR7_MUSPF|nr:uncharacterized protein LOC123387983 [Mustela putorius furo]
MGFAVSYVAIMVHVNSNPFLKEVQKHRSSRIQIFSRLTCPITTPAPPTSPFSINSGAPKLHRESKRGPDLGGGGWGCQELIISPEGKRGRRQKKGSSRRTGGWGGYLETTPAGIGGAAYIPGEERRSQQCQRLSFKKQNCWRPPERWEPKEGGGAQPGRPSRATGTKEADWRRRRLPAALLHRSPALAARNKVYILLRPHPPPPTQDRVLLPQTPLGTPSTAPAFQPAQQRDTPTGEGKQPRRASRAGRASASREATPESPLAERSFSCSATNRLCNIWNFHLHPHPSHPKILNSPLLSN